MRVRILVASLLLILVGAIAFAIWPTADRAPAPYEPVVAAPRGDTSTPVAPARLPDAPRGAPQPVVAQPVAVAPVSQTTPSPAPAGELDPEADPEHLRALGLTEADVEPLDGGPLHALTRDGIKGAISEKLPEIKECYEGWLEQDPTLKGRMKVEFNIVEIPGRARGKVTSVEVVDGGIGHLAMEGCVRNVFKDMRFESPKGGELRVAYPLHFSNDGPPPAEK